MERLQPQNLNRLISKENLNRVACRRLPALMFQHPLRDEFSHCLAGGFALELCELRRWL